jgi:23S rRNA (pseudouridine1915-N3)-methyltransferase
VGRLGVKIELATVAGRGRDIFESLAEFYSARIRKYAQLEERQHRSEETLLQSLEKQKARTPAGVILLDEGGKLLSSTEFAQWLGRERDAGRQNMVFAIGPADGWSQASRSRADMLLSLGRMTLAHELARVVLCEQIYRAFTILAGHPYHTGH